jgi:hypothetical protein
MRKFGRRALLAAITGSAFALLAVQSLPAQAANGKTAAGVSAASPASATCGTSVVGFAYINNGITGNHLGSIELVYDSCTQYVWAHGTTYETCHSDGTNCVHAYVMDPDNSTDASCESGHNGQPQETCNTAKINDAGVRHFALGAIGVWEASTPLF